MQETAQLNWLIPILTFLLGICGTGFILWMKFSGRLTAVETTQEIREEAHDKDMKRVTAAVEEIRIELRSAASEIKSDVKEIFRIMREESQR